MLFDDGSISTLLAGLQAVASRVFTRAFSDWAWVPRGPLGWVSAHTVLHSGSYPAVADALQLRPDDELLDLGCGSAGFLAGQADRVRPVAGIDLSDIQVGLARRRLAQRIAASTAQIVHGDAAALPWPDATFTVVTCMSVFEAFPDPPAVVAEVFRVLRPGGRAVLNVGERVPPGTQTHRILNGSGWVWAEDDVGEQPVEGGVLAPGDVVDGHLGEAGLLDHGSGRKSAQRTPGSFGRIRSARITSGLGEAGPPPSPRPQ